MMFARFYRFAENSRFAVPFRLSVLAVLSAALFIACASAEPERARAARMKVQTTSSGPVKQPVSFSCDLKNALKKSIFHYRSAFGLTRLREDPELSRAAQNRVETLAREGKLYHMGPGGGPLDRLKRMGIERDAVGENIARVKLQAGQDPLQAIARRRRSRAEIENINNPEYLKIGLGLAPGSEYCYYVVLLTN